ncbi:MAG: hypothetical protein ACYDGX_06580, partial [Thermoleophilia bacterium]
GRKAAAGVFLGHSKSSFLPDFEVDIIAVTHSKLVVQGVGLRSGFLFSLGFVFSFVVVAENFISVWRTL